MELGARRALLWEPTGLTERGNTPGPLDSRHATDGKLWHGSLVVAGAFLRPDFTARAGAPDWGHAISKFVKSSKYKRSSVTLGMPGNVQISNLLTPAHLLRNIYHGEIIEEGYPRIDHQSTDSSGVASRTITLSRQISSRVPSG